MAERSCDRDWVNNCKGNGGVEADEVEEEVNVDQLKRASDGHFRCQGSLHRYSRFSGCPMRCCLSGEGMGARAAASAALPRICSEIRIPSYCHQLLPASGRWEPSRLSTSIAGGNRVGDKQGKETPLE